MGQAKNRGTYEERRELAIDRDNEIRELYEVERMAIEKARYKARIARGRLLNLVGRGTANRVAILGAISSMAITTEASIRHSKIPKVVNVGTIGHIDHD